MKQIITILLFTVLCINSNAQCNLPYKPLTEFGTDTVAFMTYNFRDRADCYKGKTLKEVTLDLQIPIKDFMMIDNRLSDDNKSEGIYIYIYPHNYARKAMYDGKVFNSIYIEWEDALPENEYTRKDRQGWNNDIYNYLKNIKIKSIRYTDRIRKPVGAHP
ncbi:MAG: hypothetical protein ACK5M3_19465 [Dysgonomonas sp.]